ncbi:MIP/aquaporin family protein [Leifsonia sp. NCR5]|uniref:aquaporin n=1 Tax=Leifsonia sp. NCR5 TaxID=1978342 RepID=UPI000A1961B1|nr:MIP/aquaporin family protein [Leifsonia sp. NCR5]
MYAMNTRLLPRLLAEFLGTGLLVTVVVGSGIAASRLSHDTGLQLLENSIATAFGLAVLIVLFGSVSGAHFNPVVSLVDWIVGRSARNGLTLTEAASYILAQVFGAIGGALLANAMFELPTRVATTERVTAGTLLGEVVATAGLIMLILALARTGRSAAAAPAIGAYIGAAYWFTSSTSFANPAVTIGQIFSDSFAGIAPASVLPFIAAQLVGAAIGVALTLALFRSEKVLAQAAADVVIPQTTDR